MLGGLTIEQWVQILSVIAGLMTAYAAINYMSVRRGHGMADTIKSLSEAQAKMAEAHNISVEARDKEIRELRASHEMNLIEIDALKKSHRSLVTDHSALKKKSEIWQTDNERLVSEVAKYKKEVQKYMDISIQQGKTIQFQQVEIERLESLLRNAGIKLENKDEKEK